MIQEEVVHAGLVLLLLVIGGLAVTCMAAPVTYGRLRINGLVSDLKGPLVPEALDDAKASTPRVEWASMTNRIIKVERLSTQDQQ